MHTDQIRKQYRQARRSFSSSIQEYNAYQLSENLQHFLGSSHDLKIAGYLATQGEISLNTWLTRNLRHRTFLPMLYEPIEPRLRFAELNKNTRWKQNRYRITEPDTHWGKTLHARQLDIILMPLVCFDRQGNRMGMGGGFYDRSLAFRNTRKHWLKPLLIGVAHSGQEHPGLNRNSWDVTMDWIITEKEIIQPETR